MERRYALRGHRTGKPPPQAPLYTCLASDEGVLAGTAGVRLDWPLGLSADKRYAAALAGLRADGAKLCEFTRRAVDAKAASKPVLGRSDAGARQLSPSARMAFARCSYSA